GRIAEEMINGIDGVTTGASNDIKRATEIARNMVMKWGLSEKMGPLVYDESEEEGILGLTAATGLRNLVSTETAKDIDHEVRRIIDECYSSAKNLLVENRDKLDVMAEALIQYETIDSIQIDDIMAGRKPRPPSDWNSNPPSGGETAPPES